MANINKLQMASAVCADSRISVSKSLLGLRTTVTYNPSNSVCNVKTLEYNAADGDRLKAVLDHPESMGDFRPKATVNGNYMAELVQSRDHAFVAVQLLRFSQLNYEPVGQPYLFEGDDARRVSQLFD